ncbi:unnamed protein product [Thelazia callipaeda]|uniref:F-box domain-containing protein n=1 Tax=Thelazia callipaeda TaxID=103827 RepID=A0A0N5CP02_THECL|nr:unnamed protein product [Thelazia callipaeda]
MGYVCDKKGESEASNSSNEFTDSEDEWTPEQQVYHNDVIMRKVVAFVSNIKDRRNLELSSRFFHNISKRVPFIDCGNSNTVLELVFTKLEPIMTLRIAGNEFNVRVITSHVRSNRSDGSLLQHESSMARIRSIIRRFSRQIYSLRVGGITDYERRLGYIPNHQLVLSRDLCAEFDSLKNIRSLVLRNICLVRPSILYWSGTDCFLSNRISSLCFHNIWFDSMRDMGNFMTMISSSVRRLYVSDSSGKTITNIETQIKNLGTKLDLLYLAIDYRAFRNLNQACQVFQGASEVAKDINVCICFSRFVSQAGFQILLNFVTLLPNYNKITVLELDLGSMRRNVDCCKQFFTALPRLTNLRVLHLFGHPIGHNCMQFWDEMLLSLEQLCSVTELSIVNLFRNIRSENFELFCRSLPVNLNVLSLQQVQHLKDNHFEIISARCPNLDTLYMLNLRSVTEDGLTKSITNLRKLTNLALYHSDAAVLKACKFLANRTWMPYIRAVILGCAKKKLDSSLVETLKYRLPHCKLLDSGKWHEYECHLWSCRQSYEKLLAASSYADCPECGKDVSIFSDDDDIL